MHVEIGIARRRAGKGDFKDAPTFDRQARSEPDPGKWVSLTGCPAAQRAKVHGARQKQEKGFGIHGVDSSFFLLVRKVWLRVRKRTSSSSCPGPRREKHGKAQGGKALSCNISALRLFLPGIHLSIARRAQHRRSQALISGAFQEFSDSGGRRTSAGIVRRRKPWQERKNDVTLWPTRT